MGPKALLFRYLDPRGIEPPACPVEEREPSARRGPEPKARAVAVLGQLLGLGFRASGFRV